MTLISSLRSLVLDYKKQVNNNVIIETSLNQLVPIILADADKLKEAFNNLIANAIAATDSGGTIRISTYPSFDRVVITIEDWGAGISPEIQQKIFEPFSPPNRAGQASGLAIAKKNIEAHPGFHPGGKSTGLGHQFTITLHVYNKRPEGSNLYGVNDYERVLKK